jgi:RNA polymerase sigma factor (sigma-70 family)
MVSDPSGQQGSGDAKGTGGKPRGGDPARMASEELLPLVYQELRALAASMLAGERERGGIAGGVTLQPTVLVHEAYLRLLGPQGESKGENPDWDGRRHFFGAAAIAMRRILIDRARHLKGLAGHVRGDGGVSIEDRSLPNFADEAEVGGMGGAGGGRAPSGLEGVGGADSMLHLDAAMDALAAVDTRRHEVVMLRFFAGLTVEQTAQVLKVSPATVKNDWAFARAWLLRDMERRKCGGEEGMVS